MKLVDMNTVSLGDISKIYDQKRIPLNSRERLLRRGSIPYYGAQGVIDFVDDYIFEGDYVLIAEDGENLRSKKQPIALRTQGKFWVNNHAHIIQGNQPWLNDYIEAFFHYADISPYITGAAQPKLNQANLLKIRMPFDQKSAQEVASLWKLFRKRLELNHSAIEILEQMGGALFKHHFIDNPEVENWRIGKISDIASHLRDTRQPQKEQNTKFTHYSIPAYDNGEKPEIVLGTEIMSNKFSVPNNSILVSKLNPSTSRVWPVILAGSNSVCSTEFVCLIVKKYYSFLYFLLCSKMYQDTMVAAAGGTSNSHKRVSPDFIMSFAFKMPPKELVSDFELELRRNLILREHLFRENSTLESLRDTLIPRLMRGEIDL